MTLGQLVKSLRLGLPETTSIERAARGIGVSTQTLWRVESGAQDTPSLKTMQLIADFYEVPITDLIDLRVEKAS